MKKYLLILLLASVSCFADPLKIIVPYAAGGATDVAARITARELSTQFNIDAVVINRPGAEGAIGLNEMLHQKPDGNTILFTGSSSIIYNSAANPANYATMKKLVPVAKMTAGGQVLLTKKGSAITTWKQLVAASKTQTVSIGTNSALARDLLLELFPNNPNIIIVPFNGDAPTYAALLSNTVDAVLNTFTFAGRVATGEANGLAVSTEQGKFGIPSFTELGVRIVREQWWGVFMPPGTNTELRNNLALQLNTIKTRKTYQDSVRQVTSFVPAITTPNEFAFAIEKEYQQVMKK